VPHNAIAVSQQAVCALEAGWDGFVQKAQFDNCQHQNPSGTCNCDFSISIPPMPAIHKLEPVRSNQAVLGPSAKSNMHRSTRA